MNSHVRQIGKKLIVSLGSGKWITSRVIGPLAIVLAVLVLVVSETGHQELRAITMEREGNVNTQLTVGGLRRSLLVMESATRGYLITGRKEYLQPYQKETVAFQKYLDSAKTLASNKSLTMSVFSKIVEIAERKQAEMQDMIRLFQSGDRIGAMMVLETNVGLQMMTEFTAMVDQVIQQESASFTKAGSVRQKSSDVSRLLIWILVAASLVGAFILMRLSRAREKDHLLHMAALHAERDRLDQEVTHRTAETVSLALHMDRVREDERGRLARELHDELGGLLTAAKLDVARIRKRLPESGLGQDLLLHLSQSLDSGIALKRRIIEDLRPSSLANLGLTTTLLIQCKEFSQRAEIKVETDIADVTLPNDHALTVYRIVQEALTNVAKYAAASEVRVSMRPVGERLEVRVTDDGKGFDPKIALSASGRGLQGMKFRVRACGGELHIHSSPGAGTVLIATIPYDTSSTPALES